VKGKSRNFLQRKFREYYKDQGTKIQQPTSIERREFGFFLFKKGMMSRHRGFTSITELRATLKDIGPSDAYYSAAYYRYPTKDMEKKEWQGADLVFDIDADHLETDCKKTHVIWICKKCQKTGIGEPPTRCPECSGKINDTNWICENCLEDTKREAIKLLEFLTDDFGFSSESISVCFSGNRGYHVHVEAETVMDLDQHARREIVDYVRGTGLEVELHGLSERILTTRETNLGPDLTDPGWRGRLARTAYRLLVETSEEDLVNRVGLQRKTAKVIISERNNISEFWKVSPPWYSLRGVGPKSWERIIQFAIGEQAANIDTVVTYDIHRLIRLPETLHGKTGFRTAIVPVEELKRFDPLSETLAFEGGEIKICVTNSPEFQLGGETYGPFKDENLELPAAAAIMLLCKGLASPLE